VSVSNDVTIGRFAGRVHNVVHWSGLADGGHFAALEAPDFLIGDMCDLFRRVAPMRR
jgi:epoxide hydrolase